MTQRIETLCEIIDQFDVFIIDQFGVLHDGAAPYTGAIEALETLRSHHKSVLILSNSGKRAQINIKRFERLGFHRTLFDHFITSGEIAWVYIHRGGPQFPQHRPLNCFLISRDGDRSAVEGLDIQLTEDAAQADLIIIGASEGDIFDEEHYRRVLRAAAGKNTLCLCTNPDKIMLTRAGPRFGAGRIAEIYEEMGGSVTWIGKPFPEIYRFALELLGNPDVGRVLCIGDSIEHDVAGGLACGAKTLLVEGGILAGISPAELSHQIHLYKTRPDFQIPMLRA